MQLIPLSQKGYFIWNNENRIAFCFKKGRFIGPQNQRFRLKKGCFSRPEAAKRGYFSSTTVVYVFVGGGGGGYWRHMATRIWVNIGSGNSLLPSRRQVISWTDAVFSLVRSSDIHRQAISQWVPNLQICIMTENCTFKIIATFPRGQWGMNGGRLLSIEFVKLRVKEKGNESV